MVFSLRSYQEEAVTDLLDSILRGETSGVTALVTGGGKSVILAEAVRRVRTMWNGRVLVLTHVAELVTQDVAAIAKLNTPFDIGVNCAALNRRDTQHPIVVATIGSIAKNLDALGVRHLVLIDECFPGHVEVLTATGFKRFDMLTEADTVAQVDGTFKLSFCKPKLVATKPATPVVRLHSAQAIDLPMTSGHQIVQYRKADGTVRKCAVTDATFNYTWSLPAGASSTAVASDADLTVFERYAIAFQADGSYHNRCSSAAQITAFMFSKQRKIDAFRVLLADGEWTYREELVARGVSDKVKPRTRFFVYGAPHVTKDVASVFNLTELSTLKARKIVEYMNIWDGHVAAKNTYLFTSTDKRATDFYQAVAVIAGYTARQRTVVDTRKSTYSDVHRLSIIKQQFIGTQNMHLDTNVPEQPDKVYCVRVPEGNIVVRSNGATVITGNCHRVSVAEQTQYNQVIRHFRALTPKMYTWGLTATPYRQGQGLLTDGDGALFDQIITDMTVGDKFTWFIDQGYLVDVKSVRTETEIDVAEVSVSNSGEFNQKELQQVTDQHEITRKILLEAEPHIIASRACMIFAVGVSHAWHVHAQLAELLGIHAVVVVGDTATKDRSEAFRLFKTGAAKVLINCGVATTGFDYPAVDLLVVIRAIRSTSLWVQIVGRALRPVYAPGYDLSTQEGRLAAIEHSPKGRYAKVLDFGGNAMRLGEVNAPAIPSNKKKNRDPNAPNEPPPAKSCPSCQAVMASNVRECRFCGFEFPITTLHAHADGSDIIKRESDKAEAPAIPKPKGSRIHHTVYSTVYSVHVAKNGQSQLRAVYTTGRGTVSEFFSFATEAKAEGRLRAWWRKVTPPKTAVPKTAREAVDFLTGGTVESIAFVVTQLKGDYNNVVGHFHTREALDAFMGEPTSE